MKKMNHGIKGNESKRKVMKAREKRQIKLERHEAEIEEIYAVYEKKPVYVQYLPDVCCIKGAEMTSRLSHNYQLAEQVAMESEEKLQKQSMRISTHPLEINNYMIVLDSLEIGNLSIFEPHGKSIYVDHLSDGCVIRGAELIAEIKTNILSEERAVLITEIYCKDGYEELAKAMIDQVKFFIEYYEEYDKFGMVDSVHRKWGPYKA